MSVQLFFTFRWGGINEDSSLLSDYPRVVTLRVAPTDFCYDQNYVEDTARDGRIFCASDPDGDKDSCAGDSGGPMLCQNIDGFWHLAGIVSYGIGNCSYPDRPGAYTSTYYFEDWIPIAMERLDSKGLTVRETSQQMEDKQNSLPSSNSESSSSSSSSDLLAFQRVGSGNVVKITWSSNDLVDLFGCYCQIYCALHLPATWLWFYLSKTGITKLDTWFGWIIRCSWGSLVLVRKMIFFSTDIRYFTSIFI